MDWEKWDEAGKASKYFQSFKVYILFCTNNKEQFIKIGKTFQSIGKRYNSKKSLPYDYNVLTYLEFNNGLLCSQYEQQLIQKYKDFSYLPLISFLVNMNVFLFPY